MSRVPTHTHRQQVQPATEPNQRQDQRTPTSVELAEMLMKTMLAFKRRGNMCFAQQHNELSMARVRLLAAMGDAPRARMGDLSAALGVTPRNITTIVDGLEGEGLIARRPDPTDRRATQVELTAKGREHLEQIHVMHRELSEQFFTVLDESERCYLFTLLSRLQEGLLDT